MMHACLAIFVRGPHYHWSCGVSLVFVCDANFAAHKQKVHSGENEYRKRVLFLMEQSGSRPIAGQEKRILVQTFAQFQQFFRPGAKGNTFARIPEEPRCEAACVLCQRKDFIEHRPAGAA